MIKKKIVITGGSGRFGEIIKRDFDRSKYNIYFPNKTNLNILNLVSIKKYLKTKKTKLFNSFSRLIKANEFT